MGLSSFLSAIITRALFILLALVAVWRVIWVKKHPYYWLLTLLFLPLVVEMVITLRKRKGLEYKWFSPTIFLFLISIIPSIWILELHTTAEQKGKCNYDSFTQLWQPGINDSSRNSTISLKRLRDVLSSFCEDSWILALHQILLILLIIGKWLLPLGGGITRDQLSQLLLIFVGTAADILEFNSETLDDVKENSSELVYVILSVWSWSMLQFPCHLCVVGPMTDEPADERVQGDSLWSNRSTDLWSIVETLFIHDGPFLVVRLVVMIHFGTFHQMLVFFAFKNFLVVILNVYRLCVLYLDFKSSVHSPVGDSAD
ncbi:transmembrane protein 26-like [Poeciliopsis prolifica]|uniref:transmembrane protein 26-like n=1 Tax=Poeciliopsis prolifica TaxID=188132 RepID=UPI00241384E5|nr:transmembrane protein 26-like [Poeciliopsis prolifica]